MKHESLCTKDAYPIAFSELVTYINEAKATSVDNGPLVFKLADLVTLCQSRVVQLGVGLPDVHATRLKENLLFHIPQMRAFSKGRDVLLAYDTDVEYILAQTSKYSEAIHLAMAAELIRRDMLNNSRPPFTTVHHRFSRWMSSAVCPSITCCICRHDWTRRSHHERGLQQFEVFLGGLHNEEWSFYNPIKNNKVAFFKQEQRVSSSKENALKGDGRLFSRLFISYQTRQCDLQEFFRHENQSSPASLSDGGKLHTCLKSKLTESLHAQVDMPERAPEWEVIIVDGSAMVNSTPPRTSKTFEYYAQEDILPKIKFYGAT